MELKQLQCIRPRKLPGAAFDAVLLDITVSGGMGGIEAAAKLKELDPCGQIGCFQRLLRRICHV